MRKADALTDLEKLKVQIVAEVKSTAFGVILTGEAEPVKVFADFAAENAGTINVAADGLFDRICDDIEPSIGDRRTFGTTQLSLMISSMSRLGRDLRLENTLPVPQIDDLVIVKTRDALREYVRSLLRRANAAEVLNSAWIEKQVSDKAMEIRYTHHVVPVVLTGAAEVEAATLKQTLFSGKTFIHKVTKENSNPEAVMQALGEIRKQLKSQKKPQEQTSTPTL